MKIREQAYKKGNLRRKLAEAEGIEFQKLVYNLMSEVFVELTYSYDLGSVDKSGIDMYVPGSENTMRLAFQVKGIKRIDFDFEGRHLQDVTKSLQAFLSSPIKADRYILIINRPIKGKEFRQDLDRLVNSVVDKGKADEASWFDLSSFQRFIVERVAQDLWNEIAKVNQGLRNEFERLMGHAFFVENTPYSTLHLKESELEDYRISRPLKNPLKDLSQLVSSGAKKETGRELDRIKLIVPILLGEFGFGKTWLLMKLGFFLANKDFIVLHVPFAALPDDAFHARDRFFKAIYNEFFEGEKRSEFSLDFKWSVYSELLQGSNSVLLLDGMDEFEPAYSIEGINTIINLIRKINSIVVLSMRKEYFDYYFGTFRNALGRNYFNRKIILLRDWTEDNINEFAERWIQTKKRRKRQLLDEFISGKPESLLGDIPRRPLFLTMLVDKVSEKGFRHENIPDLYMYFVKKKLDRDIISWYQNHRTGRPTLDPKYDLFQVLEKTLLLLEHLAFHSVKHEEDGTIFLGEIPETQIEASLDRLHLSPQMVLPIVMNSLLKLARGRKIGTATYRFAHDSFHEFFLARYIHHNAITNIDSYPLVVREFVKLIKNHEPR